MKCSNNRNEAWQGRKLCNLVNDPKNTNLADIFGHSANVAQLSAKPSKTLNTTFRADGAAHEAKDASVGDVRIGIGLAASPFAPFGRGGMHRLLHIP
ncbi:MAG: hypothetical protein ABIP20_15615 [Chthoniobacteraceae bacterium]